MGSIHRKKGKSGTKKYGRNKMNCEQYRREHRREKNKIRKILKHLSIHPNDHMSKKRMCGLELSV